MPAAAPAHAWPAPAATSTGLNGRLISCGRLLLPPVPLSPSSPSPSKPQHDTPEGLIAHEKLSPLAIAVTLARPVTFAGELSPPDMPLPTSPSSFSPQQVTVLSPSSAQLWLTPSASCTALL